jgi:hypothetical protein
MIREDNTRKPTGRHEIICILELLERRQLLSTTNDPSLADQYALTNTGVTAAWEHDHRQRDDRRRRHRHRGRLHPPGPVREHLDQPRRDPASVKAKLKDTDGDGIISFYDLNNATDRSS